MEKTNVLTVGILSDVRPDTIFDLKNGQGSFLYNHNIKRVMVLEDEQGGIEITEDPEKSTREMFQYDSLRCEYPRTSDNIFSTLLSAKYPPSRENKLINEYQSAAMGIIDKSYKNPYKDFLRDRISIKAMVEEDCEQYNIP